tara:strand:- start:1244 stop:1996 length:753 start_codon:yes stop_codon:yes gene_type:complete
MDLELKGKKILVTGGAKGIGRGVSEKLISLGCDVAVISKTKETLSNFTAIEDSLKFQCDVSKEKNVKSIMPLVSEVLGGLDILICNVGDGRSVPPGQESYKEWKKMFDVNFFSTTNMVEGSISELKKSKGSIICISSICGNQVIEGAPVTYSVAKSALNFYVKSISKPLGKLGIRINAISLGNIMFEGSTWDKKIQDNEDQVKEMIENSVALNRFGTLNDVSSLVAYLASPSSSFATGSVWNLDGGQVNS